MTPLTRKRTRDSWWAMWLRCSQTKEKSYKHYGGRGISVLPDWLSFEDFLADMGPRPDGMFLERIDNNGHYCPQNCRWATRKEQANNKRNTVWLTHNGKKQTISQWSDEFGISRITIWKRINNLHWPVSKAIETPRNAANNLPRGRRKNRSPGPVGVYFWKARKKWRAQVTHNRKVYYVGVFDSVEKAIEARKLAVIKLRGNAPHFFGYDYASRPAGDDKDNG